MCDRIAIMDHGKILAEGTLDELKSRVGGRDVVTVRGAFDAGAGPAALRSVGRRAGHVRRRPGSWCLTVEGSGRGSVELLGQRAGRSTCRSTASRSSRPSLNTLFLNLTGRELRD